jgi:hypothetical protein
LDGAKPADHPADQANPNRSGDRGSRQSSGIDAAAEKEEIRSQWKWQFPAIN